MSMPPLCRAAAAAVLLAAACGCRSGAGPTFAQGVGDPPPGVAVRGAPRGGGVEMPSGPTQNGVPGQIVQAAAQEPPAARESTFARLLGPFGRPRRIPLPRTDLDNVQDGAGESAAELPETDLAEAF